MVIIFLKICSRAFVIERPGNTRPVVKLWNVVGLCVRLCFLTSIQNHQGPLFFCVTMDIWAWVNWMSPSSTYCWHPWPYSPKQDWRKCPISWMVCGYSSYSSSPHVGLRATGVAGSGDCPHWHAGTLQCVHYRSASTAHLQLSTQFSTQCIIDTWRLSPPPSPPLRLHF